MSAGAAARASIRLRTLRSYPYVGGALGTARQVVDAADSAQRVRVCGVTGKQEWGGAVYFFS